MTTLRHPLLRALLQRLLLAVLLLWGVTVLIFAAVNALPGDYAVAALGQQATPEVIASIRQSLGLDKPLLTRYLSWLWQLLQGNFGISVIC